MDHWLGCGLTPASPGGTGPPYRILGGTVDNDVLRQAPLFSALDDEAASALRSSMSETCLLYTSDAADE